MRSSRTGGSGALTGPKGLEGLSVREWRCGCGVVHDRDRNAEVNIRREETRLVPRAASREPPPFGEARKPTVP
ncbi:zinc ribbon domain-containing protein [Glycomyces sp. YM15]|uniref:zinc ribbon domain-containing protein n=1 Tax=Glycomyces sp. YM15 TaxID=2800446 RepID=UPI00196664A8